MCRCKARVIVSSLDWWTHDPSPTRANQLIIDALRTEVVRVKADGHFRTRARELLERDTRIVDALAPPRKRKGASGERG